MKMKLKQMKRKFRFNKKRSYFFIFLFLLVCSVGLGYAAIFTTLSIDGTAQFKDARWNVYFDNLNVTTGSITATTPASITNTTTVSFGVKLENPGDFYEFTVDVVNGGNMNAMIDSFNILPELTSAQQNYLSYTVTYSDGLELAQYQLLDAGYTDTLRVRFEYLENSDASLYPTEDDNVTIAFDVTYVQADSNGVDVGHILNRMIYTVNKVNTNLIGNNCVWLNQEYPETIPYYKTPAAALKALAQASSIELPFYLKHKVENGIVTESYLEFVITEALAETDFNLTAGTYTLRGGVNESGLVERPIYIQNAKTLYDAFGSNCPNNPYTDTITNSYFSCFIDNLRVTAIDRGDAGAYDSDGNNCAVDYEQHSGCVW